MSAIDSSKKKNKNIATKILSKCKGKQIMI